MAKIQGDGVETSKDLTAAVRKDLVGADGEVDISKFEATPMPKADFRSMKQFRAKFENIKGRKGVVKTPYKDMWIDANRAFIHFYDNSGGVNRDYLKGTFFDILQDPMIISTKDDSVYFFKIYKYKGENKGLFSIGMDRDGFVEYKTTYDDIVGNRMKEMVSSHKVIYYKGVSH